MDPQRFDRLARLVGSSHSRRGVLKTLAGGALTAVTGAFGGDAEAATCRAVGNSCSGDDNCCSHNCVKESRTRKICH
jgi:hypothetical protein